MVFEAQMRDARVAMVDFRKQLRAAHAATPSAAQTPATSACPSDYLSDSSDARTQTSAVAGGARAGHTGELWPVAVLRDDFDEDDDGANCVEGGLYFRL